MTPRLRKYLKLLQRPACWPALLQGVAATLEHDSALGREHFATVIDVGANKGQFATYARLRWPQARLICFEPLPAPRAKLARATRGQAEIQACALGAAPGEGELHLASRADSSSLLALGERQKTLFGMNETGVLRVPIQRLDACIRPPLARPSLLKIDVQGFELEVLKGATGLLPEIDVVYVEASDVELYQGQALHAEIERFLTAAGFRVKGCFNEQFDQGQRVQADWLFRSACEPAR
ncbi:MAG: FkbM family methyltransferase [Lamprobacter sp.]|uniref:FkbM family methyltransferase n=1 Tax=Lamprobacter sp. TaxID=3100796 RepID=UPI002B25ECDF|nr:FkbM family methyltransferase [Lamprobacter sp.]MEA3641086.1 FkbM family methyltransferase [Lamprobacter sp.]